MFKVEEKRIINYVQSADGNSESVVIDYKSKKVHDYQKAFRLLGESNFDELNKFGSICLNGFIYTIVEPFQTMHFANGKILLPNNYEGIDG